MDPTSLQNLHDIITPEPTPWLPPAPGWYALGGSLLLLLAWYGVLKYLSWNRNRYRREALAELQKLGEELKGDASCQKILPHLPILVKRTAIAAYGREQVASLAGDEWLAFLDRTGTMQGFSDGGGHLLNDCSFLPENRLRELSNEQIRQLYKTVDYWIRNHQHNKQNQ